MLTPTCGNGHDTARALGTLFVLDLTDDRKELRAALDAARTTYKLHPNDKRPYLLLVPNAPERSEAKRARKAMISFCELCPWPTITNAWRNHVTALMLGEKVEVEVAE